MKNLEKLAIVIIILTLIVTFGTPLYQIIIFRIYSPEQIGQLGLSLGLTNTIPRSIKLVVQIAIAAWLYTIAKKDNATPWIWAMLAILFGLLAPILYFAFSFYQRQTTATQTDSSQHDSPVDQSQT